MSGDAVRTLFVANRGEIARRIALTATRLGMTPVVPSLEGPAAVDLLDPAAVTGAALAAGADAVHPGYGYLAESADLARAVLDAGLTWVGPGPESIRALGDKGEARAIARRVGVPVADGEEPGDLSDTALAAAAERIGYPVLVKPAAGGGGKGIRVVRSGAELPAALAAARREAGRAFADERLLLERYVEHARHVEVQLLADAHGAVVHLGDRDCSLQRRHQKVLEEGPAPGLDGGVRRALWTEAVRMAAAVGYVSAGTCEFLVGQDGSHVFLEMNARLQVEHPVTELVTGRDFVADQLAIAGGATLGSLGLDQAAIEARLASGGHAMEVRLNAEDPAAGFLPSAGRVVAVRWPGDAAAFGPVGASGVRVDAGVDEGEVVGGRFDPLLAKLIAHGPDRASALDRLAAALDATELLGLSTNLAFLRRLVRLPVVVEARARTDSIDTDPSIAAAAAGPSVAADLPAMAWIAAARLLARPGDVAAWGAGWRMNAPARLRLEADLGSGSVARVVELPGPHAGPDTPADGAVPAALDGDTAHVSLGGRSIAVRLGPPPDLEAAVARLAPGASGAAEDVRSPMPGRILQVHVAAGDDVTAGDRIATLEAMKMEHAVTAPHDARVEELLVREGEQVERGRLVARLAARS